MVNTCFLLISHGGSSLLLFLQSLAFDLYSYYFISFSYLVFECAFLFVLIIEGSLSAFLTFDLAVL